MVIQKKNFCMLLLLISGLKQPGNDIDDFLETLVVELKEAWDGDDKEI